MARDLIRPLKIESVAGGGTQDDEFPTAADPQEDFVETMGVVICDASNRDETTVVERLGNDMRFSDGNNPAGVTLSAMLGGGFAIDSVLVDDETLDSLADDETANLLVEA